jgi:hypothetical protein
MFGTSRLETSTIWVTCIRKMEDHYEIGVVRGCTLLFQYGFELVVFLKTYVLMYPFISMDLNLFCLLRLT